MTDTPETRFAKTPDGVHLAFQVLGEGPVDVVYESGWVSNVDLMWERADIAGFLRTIASSARLIVFDKRGNGLSDSHGSTPDLETLVGDVGTVMDAADSERAALVGSTIGAAIAAMFASTYPERAAALAMIQASARVAWAPDYPWGETPEYHREETARIASGWGTGEFERWFLGSAPGVDDGYVASLARYFRHGMSRGAAAVSNEIWWNIDISEILPAIHVPTVVITRHDDPAPARFLADRISGAELWHVPEEAALPWSPGSEAMARRLLTFLIALRDEDSALNRVLATVLFTDIVDSTAHAAAMGDQRWREVRDQHDRILRGALGRYRGREIKTMGDGFLATFDGPARAVACAKAIASQVSALGIEIRAGLHTGEIELDGDDVAGIAVSIGARVGALAAASEILVSQTVKDLVAGSGLTFEDAGEHELKGVPDRWRLYRVVS